MTKFINKKSIVLLALAAVLVSAWFVNEKVLNRFAEVDEQDNPMNAELVNTYIEDDIMSGEKAVGNEFFASYRLEREKTRSADIETLKSVTASQDAYQKTDSYNKALDEIVSLVKLSEQELLVENMIKSKGFEDCIVFIHSGYVNVVVSTDEITQADAIQIQDIVAKQCDVELSKITIAKSK